MSPKTEIQFKEIREEKKTLIMAAALEVFAKKTYLGASVSMITKKAGVSKGLLYSYFENKEDLLKQIIFKGVDEFIEILSKGNEGALTEEGFSNLIDETFELLKKDPYFWKLYFSIGVQQAVMELVQHKIMELVLPFIQLLVEYYENKGVENPMAHARLLGAVMDGVSLNYIVDTEGFPLEDIKKIIIDKFK